MTQVVENHAQALRDQPQVNRIVLVSGDRIGGLSQAARDSVEQFVIDDFDYDARGWTTAFHSQRSVQLSRRLQQRLTSAGLEPANTVLHWHNHSLGKNTAAPAVIAQLAECGWRTLLQVHDFAEDNRPENYLRLITAIGADDRSAVDRYLYPVTSQIHYCALTRADAAVLIELGIPPLQVHCLPNSVVAPAAVDDTLASRPSLDEPIKKVRQLLGLPTGARWCLYPVRGIRRKNVGELLLISQLTSPDMYCGLTLCPTTAVERCSYERWRKVANDLAPRVVFDAGQHPDLTFFENLLACEFVISTSVAEGFGMSFLEPWLLGREVIARRLYNVTDDFEANGIQFTKFYDSIPIPGDAAWVAKCRRQFADSVEQAWGRMPERFRPSMKFDLPDGDSVDFARLIPTEQIHVLRRIANDSGFRREVIQRSATLVQNLAFQPAPQTVDHNAATVDRCYSLSRNRDRLISLYRAVLDARPDHSVSSPTRAGIALDLINRARPFYPCRTEEINDEPS